MSATAVAAEYGRDRGQAVFVARLLTAVVQASALIFLAGAAAQPQSGPATVPLIFMPMIVVANIVPLVVLLGAGHIPRAPLALWAVIAACVAGGFGYFEVDRDLRPLLPATSALMSFGWYVVIGLVSFVANVLVTDAIAEGRLRPSYRRLFDTAWKQGVQLALAGLFVGLFWGVLFLNARLFALIGNWSRWRLWRHGRFGCAWPSTYGRSNGCQQPSWSRSRAPNAIGYASGVTRVQNMAGAASIRDNAKQALAATSEYDIRPRSVADLHARFTVYPTGRSLPASFYDLNSGPLSGAARPYCLNPTSAKCVARFVRFRQDGPEAIVLVDADSSVFEQDAAGQWQRTATLMGKIGCPGVKDALSSGSIEMVPHPDPDLEVGGQRIVLMPVPTACDSAPQPAR